jgi:hypothetical protein
MACETALFAFEDSSAAIPHQSPGRLAIELGLSLIRSIISISSESHLRTIGAVGFRPPGVMRTPQGGANLDKVGDTGTYRYPQLSHARRGDIWCYRQRYNVLPARGICGPGVLKADFRPA